MRPLLALAIWLTLAAPVAAETITGKARVVDGDTIVINEERIRIAGIDACEIDQSYYKHGKHWPCGRIAAGYMVAHTAGQVVTCSGRSRDRYRRLIAVCLANGEDLGAGVLSQGLAIIYRNKNGVAAVPHYIPLAESAQKYSVGLWGSEYVTPAEWRKGKR